MTPGIDGLHRAVLGLASRHEVDDWLDRHVHNHLHSNLESVTFCAGQVDAVFGVRLADGRDVVVKALRPGADLQRVRTVVQCQSLLVERGFACARVLDGPSVTGGVLAVVEDRLDCRSTGSPHDPAARDAMVTGLAAHIELLRGTNGRPLMQGRPAWANWDGGAWPAPHDPIFDFTRPVERFGWLDAAADAAAAVLRNLADRTPVVGHSDWTWQNLCVSDGRFRAAYDWDSLVFLPEPALVGMSAGAFTQGSPEPPDAPPWDAVQGFVDAYEDARGIRFDAAGRRAADAAARWVRCYNARCQLDNEVRRGIPAPPGSFLHQLVREMGRA